MHNSYDGGPNIKALCQIQRKLYKHVETSRDKVEEVFTNDKEEFDDALADMVTTFARLNTFYLTNRDNCT